MVGMGAAGVNPRGAGRVKLPNAQRVSQLSVISYRLGIAKA